MTGWLLKELSIEGFRGINNDGDPLTLKFKADRINSVFAQNGVGKSSIFDALTYALTGRIARLADLPAAEGGERYYQNRFHPTGIGTIGLIVTPEAGGADVTITVVRQPDGARTASCSDGQDADALLAELNREFVLLDARTFQRFIDNKPLERGRSFAGLLGLGKFSTLRQSLKALANTRAFNGHAGTAARNAEKIRAKGHVQTASTQIREAFLALVGEQLDPSLSKQHFDTKVHGALANIEILKDHCTGKSFPEINPDDCLNTIKAAEGGAEKEKLSELIRSEATLSEAIKLIPAIEHVETLSKIAGKRDNALSQTQGDHFLHLYKAASAIVNQETWEDKHLCPLCDMRGESSLPDRVTAKTAHYTTVTEASEELKAEWKARAWDDVTKLEALVLTKEDAPFIQPTGAAIKDGKFDLTTAEALEVRLCTLKEAAEAKLSDTSAGKNELEARLPKSLVNITEKIEAARRLQVALIAHDKAMGELSGIEASIALADRVKTFLDNAASIFATAESDAAKRRLAAVEPICRDYFANIMHQQIVPAISKPEGSEELTIALAQFHNLTDISAASVLSESFRNAFSISVYLAAASLYGGAAKFLVLDDITSSFDAGHQYFLMEVMRTRFARPGAANGPQVILLSHDTLLEKYFNSQTSSGAWWHQRIEGSPRTAVLAQNNAASRLKDKTLDLLNAGNTTDAAPRIRPYLEYKLEEIVSRCRIPVPIDIAMNDDKHMASNLLKAIDAAVKLHSAANQLVLEPAQVAGLNTAMATIIANYVSHWNTGQAHPFTAGSLFGVMAAIESFADCFRFAPTPGGSLQYYAALNRKT
uniref:AAA domain protein n=1 Tax=Rhizobium rhizogenes TaxID=359 RepID=A0A7S5DQT1_RHIRH|nr:AAA family ATPase [Rhizobium rhizogenes]QCL09653.1 AAA domain protein [Rhizobium rhizogenes]